MKDSIKLRANILNNLGMTYMQAGGLVEADEALHLAVSLRGEHGLGDTAEQSDSLANLGSLLRHQGRNEDALTYYEQAIELRTRLHGPEHPRNAIYLVNLVSAQLTLGWAEKAAENAERGLAVVAASSSTDPIAAALLNTKMMIAMWLARRIPSADSIDAAEKALVSLASTYGDDHAVVAESRAAILGLKLDTAADRGDACDGLGQLLVQIDSTDGVNSYVRERLHDMVSNGKVCGPG